MAEQIKIADEDIQKIQNIRTAYTQKTTELGQIAVSKIMVEQQKSKLDSLEEQAKKDYFSIQEKEQELLKELNVKYGQGSLDINTGLFTPSAA